MSSSKKNTTVRSSSVIEDIRRQCLQMVSGSISKLFDSCDDLFYDLSNNANNNKEQTLYFDSMREIRLKRNTLQRDYLTRLNAAFKKMTSSSDVTDTSAVASKLSIVESDEIEIDVALTNMSTRAHHLYSEQIYCMQTRFAALLKAVDTNKEDNPLLPEVICRLFAEVSKKHLDITIKPLIILLKQFERFVLDQMGNIYADVNERLIKAGVCPVISRKINKASAEKSVIGAKDKQRSNVTKNTVDSTRATQHNRYNIPLSSTYNQRLPLEAFKKLFASIRSGDKAPAGFKSYSNNTGPFISLSQLANLLDQAQVLVEKDDQYDEEKPYLHDITGKLLSAQSPQQPRAVGKNEDDIINLVATFFEFILDDNSIALKLRNQISRLQIPVLKLALQDKAFFADPSHPARSLINTIAAVGVIYSDEQDLSKDKVYQSIVNIVKTICHQYAFDNQIFTELFPQLEKVIEQEQHRSATIEKRTAQTEIGKSKVKAANKVARTLLVKKLHHVSLPSAAKDFLIDSWLQVMIMTLLKFSEQSQQWSTAVQTVDDLIRCCKLNKDAISRQRLKKLQPDLLKRVSIGLNLLGKDDKSVKEELEKVKSFIEADVTKVDGVDQREDAEVIEVADRIMGMQNADSKTKSAIERQQAEFAEIGYRALQQANTMKPGDWIKYKDTKKGDFVRCKLLTKIESTETFLFVNRFGVKILETSRHQLACDLQHGHITVIDNAPLFERTLAKVFVRLKQATAEK